MKPLPLDAIQAVRSDLDDESRKQLLRDLCSALVNLEVPKRAARAAVLEAVEQHPELTENPDKTARFNALFKIAVLKWRGVD